MMKFLVCFTFICAQLSQVFCSSSECKKHSAWQDSFVASDLFDVELISEVASFLNLPRKQFSFRSRGCCLLRSYQFDFIGFRERSYHWVAPYPYEDCNVTLRPFYIATTPVTIRLWEMVRKGASGHALPAVRGKPDQPVTGVGALTMQEWIDTLNRSEMGSVSGHFRLPTAYEWQFVARGGRLDAPFAWGHDREDGGRYAWTKTSSSMLRIPPEVARLEPNDYGVFDMTGLIWELVDLKAPMGAFEVCACGGSFLEPLGGEASTGYPSVVDSKWNGSDTGTLQTGFVTQFFGDQNSGRPDPSGDDFGFRLVWDPKPRFNVVERAVCED